MLLWFALLLMLLLVFFVCGDGVVVGVVDVDVCYLLMCWCCWLFVVDGVVCYCWFCLRRFCCC